MASPPRGAGCDTVGCAARQVVGTPMKNDAQAAAAAKALLAATPIRQRLNIDIRSPIAGDLLVGR